MKKSGISALVYRVTKDGFAQLEQLGMGIYADNNLNKIVYSTKARFILANAPLNNTQSAPEGVYEFSRALARYSTR